MQDFYLYDYLYCSIGTFTYVKDVTTFSTTHRDTEGVNSEKKGAVGCDRGGNIPIIHCFHVGSIMSAAVLPHFLLLRVNTATAALESRQEGLLVQRSAGHRKHSHRQNL